MLRVGKFDFKTRKQASYSGFKQVLVHIHEPLSPYQMRTSDGYIFENWWQFSKIYPIVHKIHHNNPRQYDYWQHPIETHIESDTIDSEGIRSIIPTGEYWDWRQKGFNWHRAVRYPNGRENRRSAQGSVWQNPDAKNWEFLDYIQARKKIYYQMYWDKRQDSKILELQNLLIKGCNLLINEVDGPTRTLDNPYNLVEIDALGLGSIGITPEILDTLIDCPSQAFGHGYSIAGVLLGWYPHD